MIVYWLLQQTYNRRPALLLRRWTPCHQTNGSSLFERSKDELIIGMKMSTFFSRVSLYTVGDSGKFLKLVVFYCFSCSL